MVSNYKRLDYPLIEAIILYLITLYISFLGLAIHISHSENPTISNAKLIVDQLVEVLNHEIIIMELELMGNFHNIFNKVKLKLINKFQIWIVLPLFWIV